MLTNPATKAFAPLVADAGAPLSSLTGAQK
jgi:hypothetical protein